MTAWRYQTHHSVPVLHVSIKVSVNEMKETIQAYGQTNGCHWPFVMGAVVLMTFPHGGVDVVFLVWCLVRACCYYQLQLSFKEWKQKGLL